MNYLHKLLAKVCIILCPTFLKIFFLVYKSVLINRFGLTIAKLRQVESDISIPVLNFLASSSNIPLVENKMKGQSEKNVDFVSNCP